MKNLNKSELLQLRGGSVDTGSDSSAEPILATNKNTAANCICYIGTDEDKNKNRASGCSCI